MLNRRDFFKKFGLMGAAVGAAAMVVAPKRPWIGVDRAATNLSDDMTIIFKPRPTYRDGQVFRWQPAERQGHLLDSETYLPVASRLWV